jgi:hypothetical protein
MNETTFAKVEELEKQLREQCLNLDIQSKDLRARNSDLRQRNTELHQLAKSGWQADVDVQKLRLAHAELADLNEQLRAELESAQNKAKTTIATLDRRLAESNGKNEGNVAELRKHEAREKELRQKIATYERAIQSYKFDSEHLQSEVYARRAETQQIIERQERELLEHKKHEEQLLAERAELQKMIARQNVNLEALQAKHAEELRAKNFEIQSHATKASENGSALEVEIQRLLVELASKAQSLSASQS